MMRRRALKSEGGEISLRSRQLRAISRYLDYEDARGYSSLTEGIWLVLILTLLTTGSINTSATPLAYDDEGAELFWSDYYPNGIAVKFSPLSSRWRITGILVYGFMIDKGEKAFIVEIRDSNLSVIFRVSLLISGYFKNATLSWAKIPLPSVIVRSDFYVCVYSMLESNGTQLWIAVDNDTFPNRCFLIDCYRRELGDWKGGHAMIRVEGEEVIDIIEIAPKSIFMSEDALELFFRIVASSNDVETRAILQVGSLIDECVVECEKGLYKTRVEWLKLLGLKSPAKLLLSAKAINLTTTLTIELNESLFSKYLELKEENEHLRVMINSSEVELKALRDGFEKEKDSAAFLSASLKEYQKMVSEKTRENERLVEELSILRPLTISLAILTVFLLFIILRRRIRFGRFTEADEGV
jgi:hypothetical protein